MLFLIKSRQKFILYKTVIAMHDVIKKSKRIYRSTITFKLKSKKNDGSGSQEETTDKRKGKRKRLTTNFNKNKKVVRETGESPPPAE